jgi:hypothetical protein
MEIIKDKQDNEVNENFINSAIASDNLRKNIIENYNDIIQSENQNQSKMNKSLALKLNKEIQKVSK